MTDRRVRRTRGLLHRALIELMMERGYERVTVADVIDRADVGRSTFYSHYRDKDDLLQVSTTEFLRSEIAAVPAGPTPLSRLRVIFELVGRYPDVHRPLLGPKASATVLRSYRRMLEQLVGECLDEAPAPVRGRDEIVAFLAGALFGVLTAMVDPGAEPAPGRAWARFEELAMRGVGGALGDPR
ncbi:TetR/AcrR family transcriptional regulator [Nocardia thailandica]|uniref:TetR/AcrR family transcriptional regulator n=1 Tax=Nocardia thailandica TaxID=257275 RepID=A0ABW6PID7_9NOCA|nr:TetR/AcrR family transcriptional regulator [Nocardia thailandica]